MPMNVRSVNKQCTLYSKDGVLEQVTDLNAAELDIPALKERFPDLHMVTFAVEIDGKWITVGSAVLTDWRDNG